MEKSFVSRVEETIRKHQLLVSGDRPLVALSGGADSVALLRVLLQLGYSCSAAHCNFGLRGEASDHDEAFVRQLCEKLGVPLYVVRFQTLQEARKRRVSMEMVARDLRYEFFANLMTQHHYTVTAVAHHRNDNVETMLLNLVRGSGLKGLTAMRYQREGGIIRPFLDVSREDIEQYLQDLNQLYVTDVTNFVPDVKRNLVRLEVLPLLRRMNPMIDQTLQQTIVNLDEAYALCCERLQQLVEYAVVSRHGEEMDLSVEFLQQSPYCRTLLHYLLAPYGFNASLTDRMAQDGFGHQGAVFEGNENWQLWRDRGVLQLRRRLSEEPVSVRLNISGEVRLVCNGTVRVLRATIQPGAIVVKDPNVACLDADLLAVDSLWLRPIAAADRFVPFGMKGSRLVSDYLTDRKYSRLQKLRAYVLCRRQDIVWLVGERTDQRFAVAPGRTRHTVVIRMTVSEDK